MRWFKKLFAKNEKGQAMVELAFTLPILILVLCAIIDFGWVISNKLLIVYSSREGARYGMVNATATNAKILIAKRVVDSAPSYIRDDISVEVTFSDAYDVRAGDISVKVTCNVKALTPLTGIFINDQSIVLDAVCVMKVE
ncbi:MAG: TadE/TadG family type IV pilus assembly protein [Saccharofermentanales bacterium]